MTANLLRKTWTDLDSSELRLLLDACIGGPGQFDGRDENPNKFYLPLARESCRIVLTYAGSRAVAIEPDHYPHRFSTRLATRQPSTSNVKSRKPRHKVRTPGIPSL